MEIHSRSRMQGKGSAYHSGLQRTDRRLKGETIGTGIHGGLKLVHSNEEGALEQVRELRKDGADVKIAELVDQRLQGQPERQIQIHPSLQVNRALQVHARRVQQEVQQLV